MAAKRGAKPIPAPEVVGPVLDDELLAERQQQLAVMNEHTRAVIDQFGDSLPWSPEHYETRIRDELKRGCEAFLRAGRYLVVARECATHGEWEGMLGRLGLSQPTAHRMIEAARRVASLSNHSRANDLTRAAGTSSKLIELLSLPEDQFAELAEEGETNGLALDDLEGMTRAELRAAVRDARADIEAKDERAAKREREIERLQKQVRQARRDRERATPDETAEQLQLRTNATMLQLRADLFARGEDADSLYQRFTDLRAHALAVGDEATGVGDQFNSYMAGLLGDLLQDIRVLRSEFGLAQVNDEPPAWMKG